MKKILIIGCLLLLDACSIPLEPRYSTIEESGARGKQNVRRGYAPVNGLQMYYEISGEGFPLVLIPGGGSTIETNFGRVIPQLAKTHTVIAIEEQGHGHTQSIDRPFTFENSASDVVAVLNYLHISKADVMGFSNGGNIAMLIAIHHPEKVNKLIVASSMYQRSGMISGFWEQMKTATIDDMPQALKNADGKINPDPKHLQQLFEQDSKRMNAFQDLSDRDIQGIQCPTMIVIGDRDIITPSHALKMSYVIPNARLIILPGTHGSYLGEVETNNPESLIPEATVSLINEFLSPRI